ncbi:MAG: hypothetical protein U0166_14820 [Acidobacteriota bacterium]
MGFDTLVGMRVRSGQELLRQGEDSAMVFKVMEGRLGVYRETAEGRVKLYDIEDGGIAGATSVILKKNQIFTVLGEAIISVVKAYRSDDLEHAVAEDDSLFPLIVTAVLNEWRFLDRRLIDQHIAAEPDAESRSNVLGTILANLKEDIDQALQRVDDPKFLRTALQDFLKETFEIAERPTPGAVIENILWLKVNITKAAVLRTITSIVDPAERRSAMTEILTNLARATVELSDQVLA